VCLSRPQVCDVSAVRGRQSTGSCNILRRALVVLEEPTIRRNRSVGHYCCVEDSSSKAPVSSVKCATVPGTAWVR